MATGRELDGHHLRGWLRWRDKRQLLMDQAAGTAAFYERIYRWCAAEIAAPERAARGGALVIGFNGPQGCGKSTMVRALAARFAEAGQRAVAFSIDDVYLTRAQQVELAARHARNPYLQQRGYPGTHDVALGVATIKALQALPAGERMRLPAYDKSLHGGHGDRAPQSACPEVVGPVDVILWEGWMLGFRPRGAGAGLSPELAEIDRLLAAYAAWNDSLNALVQLCAETPELFLDWRAEAEARLRASGRAGMSDEAIRAYAALFKPAYALYPSILASAPLCPGHQLTITVGRDRLPLPQPESAGRA